MMLQPLKTKLVYIVSGSCTLLAIVLIYGALDRTDVQVYQALNNGSPTTTTKETRYVPVWERFVFDEERHIYTLDGKGIIWAFYDSDEPPAHIRLSLATVVCHNDDHLSVVLVHERDMVACLGGVHVNYAKLIPAHKADYFRAHVLARYGGVYIDSDTVSFGSMLHLFEKLREYDLVNIDWAPDGDHMSIGIMGPWRANGSLAIEWCRAQEEILDQKNFTKALPMGSEAPEGYPLAWAELCRNPLHEITNRIYKDGNYAVDGYRFLKLDAVGTFGQWVQMYPGMAPDVRINEMEEGKIFEFHETEMLMYFGFTKLYFTCSHLRAWRSFTSASKFWEVDYVINEMVAMSIQRCRQQKAANSSTLLDDKRRYSIHKDKTLVKDASGLAEWILIFVDSLMMDGKIEATKIVCQKIRIT